MNIILFCHSLVSDWNHGNAHYLRGIATELIARGHQLRVYEPADAWSRQNLIADHGIRPIVDFHRVYPSLQSDQYSLATLDLDDVLAEADLVIAHEWNEHELIRRLGEHRRFTGGYKLLFHDTHHRSVTDACSMSQYDLRYFDGVLAFGDIIRRIYLAKGWAARAWTWHEAADTNVFYPRRARRRGDLVWIGNWGDGERCAELKSFILNPIRKMGLRARFHGVRYPDHALTALEEAGVEYKGWLPNYRAADVFAQYRVTIHVPRSPYVEALPGIPTIRPFEAMASGIPLICSPWHDIERLFNGEKDYLTARNGAEMQRHLKLLLNEPAAARELASHALQTIRARHTCAHRVSELLAICAELGVPLHDELAPAADF